MGNFVIVCTYEKERAVALPGFERALNVNFSGARGRGLTFEALEALLRAEPAFAPGKSEMFPTVMAADAATTDADGAGVGARDDRGDWEVSEGSSRDGLNVGPLVPKLTAAEGVGRFAAARGAVVERRLENQAISRLPTSVPTPLPTLLPTPLASPLSPPLATRLPLWPACVLSC